MNSGAQKCVIQRVKKIAAVVRARFSGGNSNAARCTKSRVWSRAMMTITIPRTRSTEATRPLAILFEQLRELPALLETAERDQHRTGLQRRVG